jgi:HAD superfamily hydrolase (TIGR01490 family)
MSHAVTDGVGAVRLFGALFDTEARPNRRPLPPAPIPEDVTPQELQRAELARLPATLADTAASLALGATRTAARAVLYPSRSAARAEEYVRSLGRIFGAQAKPSPLLAGRSLERRLVGLDVPLEALKRAGKAGGGSLNDAYLAAVTGALRLYHEALGAAVESLPVAIPVNLRRDEDPAEGNFFGAVVIAAPVGVADPAERMSRIHEQVQAGRAEPAIAAPGALSPLFARLPENIRAALAEGMPKPDIQASNVPASPVPIYVAGSRIERAWAFGPVPGAGAMLTLQSLAGHLPCRREPRRRGLHGPGAVRPLPRPRLRGGAGALGRAGQGRRTARQPRGAGAAMSAHAWQAAVSEIEAGERGPQVAAIFDFDGTLIPGYSELAFVRQRLREGELGIAEIVRAAQMVLDLATGRADKRQLIEIGLREWKGRKAVAMERLGQQVFSSAIEPEIFPEMRAIIDAHRRMGHTLVVASSATHFQAGPAAAHLGIEHVLCTRLSQRRGVLTGRVDGDILFGRGKAEAVRDFAAGRGIDLARSWFYADGDEDEALMHLVGHPRPTQPQPQLARVAARRGWPVRRFTSRGRPDTALVLKNSPRPQAPCPCSRARRR